MLDLFLFEIVPFYLGWRLTKSLHFTARSRRNCCRRETKFRTILPTRTKLCSKDIKIESSRPKNVEKLNLKFTTTTMTFQNWFVCTKRRNTDNNNNNILNALSYKIVHIVPSNLEWPIHFFRNFIGLKFYLKWRSSQSQVWISIIFKTRKSENHSYYVLTWYT